jgi:hypothetical protein
VAVNINNDNIYKQQETPFRSSAPEDEKGKHEKSQSNHVA